MHYSVERWQGNPEGSQSTREATLSEAMRGVQRSGRRVTLQRDSEFRSRRHMSPWNSKRKQFCEIFLRVLFHFAPALNIGRVRQHQIAFAI